VGLACTSHATWPQRGRPIEVAVAQSSLRLNAHELRHYSKDVLNVISTATMVRLGKTMEIDGRCAATNENSVIVHSNRRADTVSLGVSPASNLPAGRPNGLGDLVGHVVAEAVSARPVRGAVRPALDSLRAPRADTRLNRWSASVWRAFVTISCRGDVALHDGEVVAVDSPVRLALPFRTRRRTSEWLRRVDLLHADVDEIIEMVGPYARRGGGLSADIDHERVRRTRRRNTTERSKGRNVDGAVILPTHLKDSLSSASGTHPTRCCATDSTVGTTARPRRCRVMTIPESLGPRTH